MRNRWFIAIGATCIVAVALVFEGNAAEADVAVVDNAPIIEEQVGYIRPAPVGEDKRTLDKTVQRATPKYRKRYVRCKRLRGEKPVKQRGTFQDAKKCFNRYLAPLRSGDFHKALRWGSVFFGESYDWIHACVHGEGGHGPRLVWNLGGGPYYGPGQFHSGTYTRMSAGAFWEMRSRGVFVQRSFFWDLSYPQGRPDTLMGQALAMAHGWNGGREWTAAAC